MQNRRRVRSVFVLIWTGIIAFGAYQWHLKRTRTPTLQIFPATHSIFEQVDRVETFRLADFHEMMRPDAENAAIETEKYGTVHQYTVTRVGKEQDAAFAQELLAALEQSPRPTPFGQFSACFDPGVGFRVHRGKSFTEVFVCFHCSGVEIVTTDENKKEVWTTRTELGKARKPLLLLSRRAFPDDKILQDLKADDKPKKS